MNKYIYIAIATFIAYMLKVLAGFGASLILMPVFSLVMDIKTATILACLGDVISSFLIFLKYRNHVKWKMLIRLTVFLFIGTFIGVTLFTKLDSSILKKFFGGFILIYIVLQVFISKTAHNKKKLNTLWSIPFGLLAGISGGIFNINGPFLVIYMNHACNSKSAIKANLIALFFVDSVWRSLLFLIKGNMTIDATTVFASAMLPMLILALSIGFKIDKKIKNKGYEFISKSLLFVTAVKMLAA